MNEFKRKSVFIVLCVTHNIRTIWLFCEIASIPGF